MYPWGVYPLLALCAAAAVYYVMCAAAVRAFFARPRPIAPEFAPPITILKPVKGPEPADYESFASFCRQEYPRYQLLFGTMEPDDPIVGMVERLRGEFPDREIDLVVCGEELGANRKVSNLRNMEREARCDILLISDADMRVAPDYLCRVSQPLATRLYHRP